ncbi:redoxin domain-containing protein [Dinghuibacter silviterrae]|uniref:Peroxiredoxin n=1 Tax=Dinghuibacter silviterrae TaxID=1539049 RepID=A0A4R8DU33_9BACT|nr:redoxin domain-containing protein [Dinghuibacter silviterrae]TDX01426.1 peroxiredoxin [Dinghuibacter silviterrae]
MKTILICFALAGICSGANAQTAAHHATTAAAHRTSAPAQEQRDTLAPYAYGLANSKDPLSRDTLRGILDTLKASAGERHLQIAANIYAFIKEKATADSLRKVIREKFPLGDEARGEAEQAIYNEKDPAQKEALYKAWVAKFPPSRFPNIDHDHIVYDYARMSLANAFAEAGNDTKALYWAGRCEEDFYFGNIYGGLGEHYVKLGKLHMAETCTKKALLSAQKYYEEKNPDNAAKFAGSGYPGLMTSYTDILIKEKKYTEALPWAKKALALQKEPSPRLAFVYSKLLMTRHRYTEAFHYMEGTLKAGQANTEMIDTFKVLYVKVHGGLTGYDAYADAIHKAFLQDMHNRLTKEKMDLPAPDFTLTDVNGKSVTLSDYKGKTVVLDFWATWCTPCKASFPSMKRVVEKYSADTNVAFLFIHTWEHDTGATAAAKTFIEQHQYPFEVLMDLKDPKDGANKVVESYKVSGIPTKFVVDGNGKIRFKFTGFDGGDDAAVEEVSAMIEMARG